MMVSNLQRKIASLTRLLNYLTRQMRMATCNLILNVRHQAYQKLVKLKQTQKALRKKFAALSIPLSAFHDDLLTVDVDRRDGANGGRTGLPNFSFNISTAAEKDILSSIPYQKNEDLGSKNLCHI